MTMEQKQPPEVLIKIGVFKILQISQEKTDVEVSF